MLVGEKKEKQRNKKQEQKNKLSGGGGGLACLCVPERKPMAGERVSNFWSCLFLSSGEIAHTVTPPAD